MSSIFTTSLVLSSFLIRACNLALLYSVAPVSRRSNLFETVPTLSVSSISSSTEVASSSWTSLSWSSWVLPIFLDLTDAEVATLSLTSLFFLSFLEVLPVFLLKVLILSVVESSLLLLLWIPMLVDFFGSLSLNFGVLIVPWFFFYFYFPLGNG